MAAPTKAGLAPDLDLADGYILEFTALDPTTGNDVTSVVVSRATFTVATVAGTDAGTPLVPVDPLFVPIPANELE